MFGMLLANISVKGACMKKRYLQLAVLLGLLILPCVLMAQDASTAGTVTAQTGYTKAEVDALLSQKTDTGVITMIWMVLTGALVFMMQGGFAMVEVGLTRSKNTGNILMKNLMDFCLGSIAFFFIGWGLMYGASIGGLFGSKEFFLLGIPADAWANKMRDWFFQDVFAATAATIVSGAVAERIKFKAYLIYTVFISALVYPVAGHWIWGGGWLSQLGMHDYAGSTVVHSIGGWSALAGAIALGPRIGKYVKVNGKTVSKAIPGHNMTFAMLGVFLLWFGWYGFNPGSSLNGNDPFIAHVAVTTTLGACAGACAALFLSWVWFKKPDVSMTMNGTLAGLVAITAPCYVVDPLPAIVIGAVGGLLVVVAVEFFDKVAHVDDPAGAISVHLVNGVWGTLAVGLFAVPGRLPTNPVLAKGGLFYSGSWASLGVQALGVLSVGVWVFGLMFALFSVLKATKNLRVSAKVEQQGLDISEHGADAYHGFQIFTNM
jgi:ammonium transporter, Amt family